MVLHTGQVGVVNIIVKAAFMSGVGSDFLRQLRLILLWCQGCSHLVQGEHLLATQWPAGKLSIPSHPQRRVLCSARALSAGGFCHFTLDHVPSGHYY